MRANGAASIAENMRFFAVSIPRIVFHLTSAAVILGLSGCGGGGPAAPKGGSPEWHWENASFYYDRGDFAKMSAELDNVASRETRLKERARVWRTVLLMGLARGYMEVGDAYRAAIEESPDQRPTYEPLLQQVNREARQFAIELTESLGSLDEAWATNEVNCQFPFPPDEATVHPVMDGISQGQEISLEQVDTASKHTVLRGVVLAAAEFCGFGQGPESAEKAKTALDAGPVSVANDDARFATAKILLDVSLVFSRKRVDDPKIRLALIERTEQWLKPYLESENAEAKKRAEEFAKEIEDERRDMRRRARRLKKRA